MAAACVQVLQLLLPGTPVKKTGVCHEILELCSPAFKPTPPKNKAAFTRRDRKRANAHKQQLQAKANFFNKSGFAKNLDYVMQVDNPTRRADTVVKHTGRGGWKKLTVECILKTASTPPTTSSRSGTPYNSGSNTYIQCVKINALAILLGQLDGIKKICRLPKLAFYITNNMCDETKLPMGWPRTRRRSVLAWHSQATWCEDPTHLVSGRALMPHDEDFVRAPAILKSYTAATLWGLMGNPDDSVGFCPGGDSKPDAYYYASLAAWDTHAVNVLVSKYLGGCLPANHFHMASFCIQHRTGSTCEEVSKKWNLIPASFCLARQMGFADFYDGLEEAVTSVLTKYLFCVETLPAAAPADDDLRKFAERLLEFCHVEQASDNCERDAAEEASGCARRKKEAQEFLEFFPPPWHGVLAHPCAAGCCGPRPCHDRQVSIRRGARLIMQVIFPRLSEPAANRYTKIFPVVVRIALMLNFYRVLRLALQTLVKGLRVDSDDEAVLHDEAAMVGAPHDTMVHQRKLQAKQQAKLMQLVEQTDHTILLFLVWLVIVRTIMPLHWRLFKRGIFFNHMTRKPVADQRIGCFEFCRGGTDSPAGKLMATLSSMLLMPETAGRKELDLLFLRYGQTTAQWPLALSVAVQISAVLVLSRIWRLCVHYFQGMPWKMAKIFDPKAPEGGQLAAAREFIAYPKGSKFLDPGFGRKLRELVETADDLFEPRLFGICQAMFMRSVVTSTYIERQFKDLTLWSRNQAQSVATMGAKRVNTTFKDVVNLWRQGEPERANKRPVWVRKNRSGYATTGLQVFARTRSQQDVFSPALNAAWEKLSQNERDHYSSKAKSQRMVAQTARSFEMTQALDDKDPERMGPWQLSSRRGKFSVNPSVVRKLTTGKSLKNLEEQWDTFVDVKALPDPMFPKTVPNDGPERHEIPAAWVADVRVMLDTMRLALRYIAEGSDAGVALEFQHDGTSVFGFIAHTMHLERENFEAELFRMRPDSASGLAMDVPSTDSDQFTLEFMSSPIDPWVWIQDETAFVLDLCKRSAVLWQIYVLSSNATGVNSRRVSKREKVDYHSLQALDKERILQQMAMKAFRKASGRTKTAAGKASGHARLKKPCGTPGGIKKPKTMDSSSSCSSGTQQSDSEKSEDEEPAVGLALKKATGRAPRRVLPKCALEGDGKILETWGGGRFAFSWIESKGVHCGWGVSCGRHVNADGTMAGTRCKKAIASAGLTEEEAKLRLKRWLVAAKDPDALGVERQRQSHIALGGPSLAEFSSTGEWGELDGEFLDLQIDALD